MAEVIDLQKEEPETPQDEKGSNVSYFACHNSGVSQVFCVRWS